MVLNVFLLNFEKGFKGDAFALTGSILNHTLRLPDF